MQHNNSEFLNTTHRILCGFVALILLFTLVATPMKVDASAAAVAIGAAGSMTPVGLGIAAVALLIALTGAIITSSSDLAVQSKSVYNSLDPSVQSWMDSTGQKLAAGGETISFVIPQTVINNFNNNYKKDDDNDKNKLSANLPYVAIGSDQLLQLDQLNPLQVMSSDVSGLLSQGVSLLQCLVLSTELMNDRFWLFRSNFYEQIVETRTGIIHTVEQTMQDMYSGLVTTRNQVVGQMVQSRLDILDSMSGLKKPLSSIANNLSGIATDIGSLSGSLDGSDDKDQLAILPNFSFTSLRDSLTSIFSGATSFFDDSGGNNGDDDEESYPLIPPISNYFDKTVNPFLGVIRDSEFMAALEAFFSFVASLWLLFPLAIRYLISFGFGVPMTFSVIKMFMG